MSNKTSNTACEQELSVSNIPIDTESILPRVVQLNMAVDESQGHTPMQEQANQSALKFKQAVLFEPIVGGRRQRSR